MDAHLDLREEYGYAGHGHACASLRILKKKGIGAYACLRLLRDCAPGGKAGAGVCGCES